MKTQIIHLNQNDDSLSVRDKMSGSQTGRVLLVWPAHGKILNRQLDLNLINRYAYALGVPLALVTADREVLYYARKLGIPTFTSLYDAQDKIWKVELPRKINLLRSKHPGQLENLQRIHQQNAVPRLEHPITRLVWLGLSVLALLTLGLFILPGARLILTPRVEIQSKQFDLSADPSLSSINLSNSTIPTYKLELSAEGQDVIDTTGVILIPNEPATGELEFTNVTEQPVSIPPGTTVSTSGDNPVRFVTSSVKEIVVNADESILVAAQAVEPGSRGNLPAESLSYLEGKLGLELMVTNPQPTHGGSDASVPSPTAQDLQILREQVSSELKQQGLAQMRSILPEDATLISPTVAIAEVLEESYYPEIGEPGDQVNLTMKVRLQCQVVAGEMLRSIILPMLNADIPMGFSPVDDSLQIYALDNLTLDSRGMTHWTLTASRKIYREVTNNQAADLVKGKTVSQAKDRISSSLQLTAPPEIVLTPKWWPILPLLTMRIEVDRTGIH